MSATKFQLALGKKNTGRPPVWFMRQAGRYHSHYQSLRARHSFMDLCKKPDLACEVTMGPIRDFDFDAAILFSDLLFPLEAMGMGLQYDPGPKLDWHVRSNADLRRLRGDENLTEHLEFQAEAIRKIRAVLPVEKGLLGFVGGPLTLFFYAVEGSHHGQLSSAHEGIRDGRFQGFVEKLLGLLARNMALQAKAGADAIAVFDTCAGEVDPMVYKEQVVPTLQALFDRFRALCPETPIVYYSKGTGPSHWSSLSKLPISCMGIDWRHDLRAVLNEWGASWAIQGNIDPRWLLLERKEMEAKVRNVFLQTRDLSASARAGWVCGLGHGVLPQTPEENVRAFVALQREILGGAAL